MTFVGELAEAQTSFGCDIPRAEECIARLQAQYDSVISQQPRQDVDQLEILCLGTIKGNRLTECVLEATQTCDWTQPWVAGQQWEELHRDIQALCETVCPGYPERIRNASLCAHGIQFEDADRGHFNSFCRSLSSSMHCARRMEMGCSFSMTRFLTELLPPNIDGMRQVCEKGCNDIDRVMNKARNCTATYDIERAPRWGNQLLRCRYYFGLMDCLRRAEGMERCINLEELFTRVNYNFSSYVYEQRQICGATTTGLSRILMSFLVVICGAIYTR
ncbi:uncharacterized protein LOC135476399 [Liolophura sinensis]|uniref:uncharacterized protein LOC135476399 n=1 Tax=Liolophura sinensis TaxID=3198878 RepID=UPI003158DA1B